MKTNWKDVAHLYLTSEISVFVFTDESITDGFLDKYRKSYPNGEYAPKFNKETWERYLRDGYKPILRPLSDMDAIEEVYGGNIERSHSSFYKTQIKREAERTVYLLSKGFDLFGLIESGQAIDKTTLTNPASGDK